MLKNLFKILAALLILLGVLVVISSRNSAGLLVAAFFIFLGLSFWPSIVNLLKKEFKNKWWAPLFFRVVLIIIFIFLIGVNNVSSPLEKQESEQDVLELKPEIQEPIIPLTAEEREARNQKEKENYEKMIREREIKAREWAANREMVKTKNHNCSDKPLAYRISQGFVEKLLKAPRSAKFPSILSGNVSVENPQSCVFIIRSYVDSQNSFGAMLRKQYLMKLKYNVDSKEWIRESYSLY